MRYVVFKASGKQYKVNEGDVVTLEHLPLTPGEIVTISEVLLYVSEGVHKVGTPFLSDVKVVGKVVEHVRGEKIRVSAFKSKVRHRRTMGHRQALTTVLIEKIVDGETSKKKEPVGKKVAEPKTTRQKKATRVRKKSA